MRLSILFLSWVISSASPSWADSSPEKSTGACTIHTVGFRRCSENTSEQLCRQAALRFEMASSWKRDQSCTDVRFQ
jgi:hypothetical protein